MRTHFLRLTPHSNEYQLPTSVFTKLPRLRVQPAAPVGRPVGAMASCMACLGHANNMINMGVCRNMCV